MSPKTTPNKEARFERDAILEGWGKIFPFDRRKKIRFFDEFGIHLEKGFPYLVRQYTEVIYLETI